LPLLYVWQDVETTPLLLPIDEAVNKAFDHLLIYALDSPAPDLLVAMARSPRFHTYTEAGALALDAAAAQ
jgi:hypothetical protein